MPQLDRKQAPAISLIHKKGIFNACCIDVEKIIFESLNLLEIHFLVKFRICSTAMLKDDDNLFFKFKSLFAKMKHII